MAHFSAALTYFEYWLQAWLSVNEYNTLTFGCIVCVHVSLFKWPQKSELLGALLCTLLHCFEVKSDRCTTVVFFMIFSSFCMIFIITAQELTDQSERTHWRWYLLYLFMKLPSSHGACSGGWILSRAECTKMLSVQSIVYSHCRYETSFLLKLAWVLEVTGIGSYGHRLSPEIPKCHILSVSFSSRLILDHPNNK